MIRKQVYSTLLHSHSSLSALCFALCLCGLLTLTGCEKEEDFRVDNTTPTLLTHADSVAYFASYSRLLSHTEGKGYPIVVMADGFDKTEVSNGTYAKALEKALSALFDREPMASLKPYIDVYGVTATSEKSGVGSVKANTVFATYFPDIKNTTEVRGDSLSIMACAEAALQQYGYTKEAARNLVLDHCLMVVLLNSSQYAGVTYFPQVQKAEKGFPVGNAISYIPLNATIRIGGTYGFKGDVFNELMQHEAVGHGIGKLADEYYYNDAEKYPESQYATESDIKLFDYLIENGFCSNVHHHADTKGQHAIEEDSWVYPFSIDSRYAAENLAWYQGAFTYVNDFFRPSYYSIMNGTGDTRNTTFNAPSRAAIYKTVRHVADPTWTWSFDEFATFDKLATTTSAAKATTTSSAKAATSAADSSSDTPPVTITTPQLRSPIIGKFELSQRRP